jgi:histidinol-phosphatase (PHP family)
MGLPADYHMHTRLCRHAVGDATDLAAQAVRLGLPEIGFSEHNPMPRDDYDDWHPLQENLDEYVEQVKKARCDHPQLAIKLALEMDYIPGMEDWIRDLAARHPWDYLIGAVHYVSDTWDLDNPKKIDEWKSRDAFEVWTIYFERLTRAAESGFFDIIAHADLCKKFRFCPEKDCTPLFTRLLQAIAKNGLAMELNTAGLRKDCKEIYPSPQIVGLAAQMDVPITFGSDAHKPEEVGMNFADAVQLARKFGYTQCCRFTQRKREMVSL